MDFTTPSEVIISATSIMCLISTLSPCSSMVVYNSWIIAFLAASIPRTFSISKISFVVVLTISTPSIFKIAPILEPSVWITHSLCSWRITTLPIPLTPLIWRSLILSASNLNSRIPCCIFSSSLENVVSKLSKLLFIFTCLKVFSITAVTSESSSLRSSRISWSISAVIMLSI